MTRVAVVTMAATLAACTAHGDGFRCEQDDQCDTGDMCAVTGYCAAASDECASGWRYGDYAAPALRNRCLSDGSGDRYGGIATGSDHTCALREDGQVWCWGRNDKGQLGDGSHTHSSVPVHAAGMPPAQRVAAGELHTCALSDGQVWCWGRNNFGQVGDGTTDDRKHPTAVVGLSNVVELGLGEYHSCARDRDGHVWCWGKNAEGQLGDGTIDDSVVPVLVSRLSNAVRLAVDGHHSCAQRGDGEVMCWGSNQFGQLGNGEQRGAVTAPLHLPWLDNATFIAAGGDHLCGLTSNHRVCCAGYNEYGQLGDGSRLNRSTPVAVQGLGRVTALVAGEWFSCARDSDGSARCWGRNEQGELGFASGGSEARAGQRVGRLKHIVQLSAGERHACAQTRDGCVWCWGSNEYGQLGVGQLVDADSEGEGAAIAPEPQAVPLGCW